MVDAAPKLAFDTNFQPMIGQKVEVAPGIVRVTAPNGDAMTFTGTNSFIVGYERVAVIDPGPADPAHLEALLAAIGGRKVEAIVLTHTHKDHSLLVPQLKAATGAPVWFEGRHRVMRRPYAFEVNLIARECDWVVRPDRVLTDGEVFAAGDVMLKAIATPGHCANHLAFGIEGTEMVLTGDHVMGWNSTIVAPPDGAMAPYMASLEKLIALPYRRYLPAHGGEIADGPGYTRALLAHRRLRNRQVVVAANKGARRVGDLLKGIYPTLNPALAMMARLTLVAHVEYLAATGEINAKRGLLGWKVGPA